MTVHTYDPFGALASSGWQAFLPGRRERIPYQPGSVAARGD